MIVSDSGTNYIYDAEGNRVEKAGSTTTDTIYFGGRPLARLSGLGSAVGTLSASGAVSSTQDYAPFGQAFTGGIQDPYQFTGKERDTESGNDYFGARYYSSAMGRFMSPDWADKPEAVPYSDLPDPQSLNLYGYVRNNPLSRIDADGHCALGSAGFSCNAHQPGAGIAEGEQYYLNQRQHDQAQQQGLSSKSGKAIDKAANKYGTTHPCSKPR